MLIHGMEGDRPVDAASPKDDWCQDGFRCDLLISKTNGQLTFVEGEIARVREVQHGRLCE